MSLCAEARTAERPGSGLAQGRSLALVCDMELDEHGKWLQIRFAAMRVPVRRPSIREGQGPH